MEHLREELRAYASDDEPPMRLEFDKVMTVARRSKRRLQTGVIASSVVAVAVAATLVTVVVSNSPPVHAAGTPAYCKTPQQDDKKRLSCVLYEVVPAQLPDGAELGRTVLMDRYDPGGEGPLEVVLVGDGFPIPVDIPGQPQPGFLPPKPGNPPVYKVVANVVGPGASILIDIQQTAERPGCEGADKCERRTLPSGREVLIRTTVVSESDGINNVVVATWHQGTAVRVVSMNRMTHPKDDVPVGKHPISVEGMIKIATAPGLYIP